MKMGATNKRISMCNTVKVSLIIDFIYTLYKTKFKVHFKSYNSLLYVVAIIIVFANNKPWQ